MPFFIRPHLTICAVMHTWRRVCVPHRLADVWLLFGHVDALRLRAKTQSTYVRPVLYVAQFTSFLDVIGSTLTASRVWRWERLDGTMTAEARKQAVSRWRMPSGPQVRCSDSDRDNRGSDRSRDRDSDRDRDKWQKDK